MLALIGKSLKPAESRARFSKAPAPSSILQDGTRLTWSHERLQWARQSKQLLSRMQHTSREPPHVKVAFRATVARRRQMKDGSWSLKPYCFQSSIRRMSHSLYKIENCIKALPPKLNFRIGGVTSIAEEIGLRIDVPPEHILQQRDWVANLEEKELAW